ncbi:hypothetical protein DEJ50_14945 [Streptomyces venezuelae]|uniref:Integral membrane protein n=1 Tax=Streptomyces venezuelae TaxID=54571 RepID=A0A5P2D707_STRVZ|nr:hypothetical protein [Streptomyces venezuelae]QES48919.1 hypothetical protein DEJ50_14945 [Streptomyces venezuelae]
MAFALRGVPGLRGLHDLRGPAAVALAYTLVQLVLVVPGTGLGWDETVYVSQVSPDVPAAFFSAPRARGITYLVAPAVLLSSDPAVLRSYLAVLSGAALFLSLAVWRPLLPARVLTVAGALFAGLWVTVLYGPQAMPNLWVAYGVLIAVGCFLRAAASTSAAGSRGALAGLAAAVCGVALMRPPDAVWLVFALGASALVVRRWRRPALLVVLAAGALLGAAEWLVEAELRYGGVVPRLRRASEIQGHLGWYPGALLDQLHALDGRTLCRPCGPEWRWPATGLWWFLVPLAVAAGLVVAVRRAAPAAREALLLAAVTGGVLAVPYLFLIGYAAPRFLLPAYVLLALPAAAGVSALAARGPVLLGAVACVALGHVAVQYSVLDAAVERSRATRAAFARVAEQLRAEGVRPPCVVSGHEAVRVAYRLGCSSRQVGGHDHSLTGGALRAAARERPVVVLVAEGHPVPAYAGDWRRLPLQPLPGLSAFRAHLAPMPSFSSTVRQHDIRKTTSNRPSSG